MQMVDKIVHFPIKVRKCMLVSNGYHAKCFWTVDLHTAIFTISVSTLLRQQVVMHKHGGGLLTRYKSEDTGEHCPITTPSRRQWSSRLCTHPLENRWVRVSSISRNTVTTPVIGTILLPAVSSNLHVNNRSQHSRPHA